MPQDPDSHDRPTPALVPRKSNPGPTHKPVSISSSLPAPVDELAPGQSLDSIVARAVEDYLESKFRKDDSQRKRANLGSNFRESINRMEEAKRKLQMDKNSDGLFPELSDSEPETSEAGSEPDSEPHPESESDSDPDDLGENPTDPLSFSQILDLIREANGLKEEEEEEQQEFQSEVHKVLKLKKKKSPSVKLPWSHQVKRAMARASREATKSPVKSSGKPKWLPIPS